MFVNYESLEQLARGSEQNLVPVHILRLTHSEGDCPEHPYTV
ncbi:MAG TPA: hypothetical protein V6D11_30895 [Waterburya sp.]